MANSEMISLSVVEEQLIADGDGSAKKELINTFDSALSELKNQEGKGLSPELFATSQALAEAISDAIKMVEVIWQKHHMPDPQS